jgi:adenylate cyclase
VNFLGALSFLPIFFLNKSGRRTLAAIWLLISIYLLTLINLYLYGYESGMSLIFVILIPLPFLTIFSRVKNLAIIFSLFCCVTWILIVSFNSNFPPHLEGINSQLNLKLNVTFIGLLLSMLFFSLSNTIHHAEKFLPQEREKSDAYMVSEGLYFPPLLSQSSQIFS